MTSPTPAYPALWRVSHAELQDEDHESSPEAKSPCSPSPYPDIVSHNSWNAPEDLNLSIRLEAAGLERNELSGDSMQSVSSDGVLDPKLTGDGRAAIVSPGLFEKEVLDPILSAGPSTGIAQASGGNVQQSGSLQDFNGSPASPSQSASMSSTGQMQSRIPLPDSTVSMNAASPPRFIGRHTSPHAVHCCGFLFHPYPLDLSPFRHKLLSKATKLSQWTSFRIMGPDEFPNDLSLGDWIYEVRRSSVSADGTMYQKCLGFFFGGDDDTVAPWSLLVTKQQLEQLFGFVPVGFLPLHVQCRLPGHFSMTLVAWMSVWDFNRLGHGLRSEVSIQTGEIGY